MTRDELQRALSTEQAPDFGALAASLGPSAVPLVRSLLEEGDLLLVSRAIHLAARLDPSYAEELIMKALNKPQKHVSWRLAAATAVREMKQDWAKPYILTRLLNDEDYGVRRIALKSVPKQADRSLRMVVNRLCQHDPDPRIMVLAERTLSRLDPMVNTA